MQIKIKYLPEEYKSKSAVPTESLTVERKASKNETMFLRVLLLISATSVCFGCAAACSGGLTYIRWGRTTCPETIGTELVYKGRAAGSHYTQTGGGSNYQCMTESPQNFDFGPGTSQASFIYGAEYETFANVPSSSLDLHDHDVPCAVCYVAPRETVLMIPGTYICPPSWTREYYGYLMTERSHPGHKGRTTFECVDAAPEVVPGGDANLDGAIFYHVEPRCGSLPCPPYDPQKEVTCVVCTR